MAEPEGVKRLTPQVLIGAYERHKAAERGRSSMATSNWPTVLAHPCEAYAVWNRTVPPQDRRKIGADLAMIFAEGRDQARMVKRDLIDAGFEVSGEEEQIAWPAFQISGRRDLLVWKPGYKEKVRVEVKSCSPWTFESIEKVEDLIESDKVWLTKWWKQVALYMVLQSVDRYWLLLKNKQNGGLKVIEFTLDNRMLQAAEAMLKKAETVNRMVAAGEVPSKAMKISDPEICAECEFYPVCLPELAMAPGAAVLTDEQAAELSAQLDRRKKLEPAFKEYKEIDEEAKVSIKALALGGIDRVVAGNWIAIVGTMERKQYTVEAQTVTTVKFAYIEKPKEPRQTKKREKANEAPVSGVSKAAGDVGKAARAKKQALATRAKAPRPVRAVLARRDEPRKA